MRNFLIGLTIIAMVTPPIWFAFSAKALITECEKDLPRNQTCILMAVPEEVEK